MAKSPGRGIFSLITSHNDRTLILLRGLVSDDVANDLSVGLLRGIPADLEGVHRDFGEPEVVRRPRDALQRLDADALRAGPLAGGVEGQDGDGVVGEHVQEDERVRRVRGRHHLDLLRVAGVRRQAGNQVGCLVY